MRNLLLKLSNNRQAERFVRRNRWSSRVVSRFVAGETIESAVQAVQVLNGQGFAASLDFLGESVTNPEEAEQTVQTYLQLLTAMRDAQLKSTVSVKLTALGLDIDPQLCRENMKRLLEAGTPERFIQIDMEGTPHTQRTLELFYDLRAKTENVGAVVQAYLYRSEADIAALIEAKARVRLCKGAYKEPPDLAFPSKADVDANYVRLMKSLLERGVYPGLATHDPKIVAAATVFAREKNIPKDRFEFQMLYGVRRDLQAQLLREGYNVTIYTPFGVAWYPYMMRRLAERPANLWFVVKNILRG